MIGDVSPAAVFSQNFYKAVTVYFTLFSQKSMIIFLNNKKGKDMR